MAQPTAKQFEKKLNQIVELAKQRVRIGEITYSSKKDSDRFDKRNWIVETEEELADALAYMTFAYIQFDAVYKLLIMTENRLSDRLKEMRNLETP